MSLIFLINWWTLWSIKSEKNAQRKKVKIVRFIWPVIRNLKIFTVPSQGTKRSKFGIFVSNSLEQIIILAVQSYWYIFWKWFYGVGKTQKSLRISSYLFWYSSTCLWIKFFQDTLSCIIYFLLPDTKSILVNYNNHNALCLRQIAWYSINRKRSFDFKITKKK